MDRKRCGVFSSSPKKLSENDAMLRRLLDKKASLHRLGYGTDRLRKDWRETQRVMHSIAKEKFVLPGVDPAEPPKTFVGGKAFVSTNTRLPKKLAGSPPGHREFAAARHTDSSMPEHPFGADNAMAASRSLPALGRAASPSKVR